MSSRRGREKRRGDQGGTSAPAISAGGRLRPLLDHEVRSVTEAAFTILEQTGMAGARDWLVTALVENGAKTRDDGRVLFPRKVVETALGRAARKVSLPGFDDHHGIEIGGGNVHIGTGGAAVQVLEPDGKSFRDSTLDDLYRIMRVLDHCPNIHYGVRPAIARDLQSPFDLDINTAFACMSATRKPIGVSFDNATHVPPVTGMFDIALGGDGRFRTHPFCMGIIVHVVPPLRYAAEGVDIMRAAIEGGMPLQICSAGQAGATSPASLAGALAQGLAESLAGLMVVDAISPGHPCIFAFMPFISDLRTGAMSGGGGESAIANAAAAQLLLDLGLPSTVSAGMTDSKIADAQAGYEKGYTIALAAHAGADMINLSVGMLGSIMVASPEAMIIDDDMCGAILRSVRGIDIGADLLDLEAIERVVTGEGHYLGEAQTLELMKSEYLYPSLADRASVDEWLDAGQPSIWDRAGTRVEEILATTPPTHVSARADAEIREHFPIMLNTEDL